MAILPHCLPGHDDTTPVKERLHQVFSSYATFGAGQASSSAGLAKVPELDSSRFAKLVREAGLLDKCFDLTSADLIFAKVRRARLLDAGLSAACHACYLRCIWQSLSWLAGTAACCKACKHQHCCEQLHASMFYMPGSPFWPSRIKA